MRLGTLVCIASLLAIESACFVPDVTLKKETRASAANGKASAKTGRIADAGREDVDDDDDHDQTEATSAPPIETPPPTPDATSEPQVRQWRGTLAATPAVPFGGGEHCNYRITLKNIVVDIGTSGGDVTAAKVTAVAFEEVLSSGCSNPPIPQHTQTFELKSSSKLSNGTRRIVLAPALTNRPLASLVIDGDFSKSPAELSLEWHRSDFGPPLDWRVTAELTAR